MVKAASAKCVTFCCGVGLRWCRRRMCHVFVQNIYVFIVRLFKSAGARSLSFCLLLHCSTSSAEFERNPKLESWLQPYKCQRLTKNTQVTPTYFLQTSRIEFCFKSHFLSFLPSQMLIIQHSFHLLKHCNEMWSAEWLRSEFLHPTRLQRFFSDEVV